MWKPKGQQGLPGCSSMVSLGKRGRTSRGVQVFPAHHSCWHCLTLPCREDWKLQFRSPASQDQLPFAVGTGHMNILKHTPHPVRIPRATQNPQLEHQQHCPRAKPTHEYSTSNGFHTNSANFPFPRRSPNPTQAAACPQYETAKMLGQRSCTAVTATGEGLKGERGKGANFTQKQH